MIGTGYVGLVTGTCLADSGNVVACVDKMQAKIDLLNAGGVPIYEPGLEELVKRNRDAERLRFTTDLLDAVKDAQLVFIAVGTPEDKTTGRADLKYVWAAGEELATLIREDAVVVIKSTVPPGTNRELAERMRRKAGRVVDVASNPEFLKEGAAVDDFSRPDRVVVGVRKPEVGAILKELYEPFLRSGKPFLVMSPESAEMTKYAANAMLATKISFINEIANICERIGADINDVRKGITTDERIGPHFLYPGPGYGGSCFPKDISALIQRAEDTHFTPLILQAVHQVNLNQKKVLPAKIRQHFGSQLRGKCLAVWGLAFKPRTDDIREGPALDVIADMLAEGVDLRVHDPEAMTNIKKEFPDAKGITYCDRPYGALEGADALVLVTEWKEFSAPDFDLMRRLMRSHVLFDGRNLYDPAKLKQHGFTYYGIGRVTK